MAQREAQGLVKYTQKNKQKASKKKSTFQTVTQAEHFF